MVGLRDILETSMLATDTIIANFTFANIHGNCHPFVSLWDSQKCPHN